MKNNNIRYIHWKFWTVIGCILVVLLCASPCSAMTIVYSGQTLNVGTGKDIVETDYLLVMGTVNLYPGAYVSQKIYALSGCVINIYGGQMGEYGLISAFSSIPDPQITVYGANFAVNGSSCGPLATAFSLETNVYETLTGVYEDREPINLRFYGSVLVYLVDVLDPEVVIDIKPGDNPNSINLKSKGVVPVAALTTVTPEVFDATTIDPTTVVFAGASPVRWAIEDVDGDGDNDMMFHFRTQELNLPPDSTQAELTGLTIEGMSIHGTDEVRIVPSKQK